MSANITKTLAARERTIANQFETITELRAELAQYRRVVEAAQYIYKKRGLYPVNQDLEDAMALLGDRLAALEGVTK